MIDENQRLRESVMTLEKMLAGVNVDREKLRAKKTQLEEDNWQLTVLLGDMVDLEKCKFLHPMVC